MTNDLVVVARFPEPTEAILVRNQLEAAGIKAALADDITVTWDWLLSNAIGGVKVLVNAEDAERAREALAEQAPTPDDLQAMATEAEAAAEPDEPATPGTADESDAPLTTREEEAERAFRGAILGLLILPALLYVTWLLLRVYFSEERLAGRPRQRAWIATAIVTPFWLGILVLLRLLVQSR